MRRSCFNFSLAQVCVGIIACLAHKAFGAVTVFPNFTAAGTIMVANAEVSTIRAFEVHINGCSWYIKSSETNGQGLVIEIGYDGSGVTRRLEFNNANSAKNSKKPKVVTGIIESNAVPVDVSGLVPHIFTFLCSACYLGDRASGIVVPVYDPNAGILLEPTKRTFARWSRWAEPPWPYRELLYFESELESIKDARQPQPQELRLARFLITSVTNLGSQIIPMSGDFFRYHLKSDAIRASGSIIVESVSECRLTNFVPRIGQKMRLSVNDRRLYLTQSSNRTLSYVSPTGEWMDLKAGSNAFVYQRTPPAERYRLRPKNWILIAAFIGLTLLPLTIWAIRKGKK